MCFTFALLRKLKENDKKRRLLFKGIDLAQKTRRPSSDRVTYMLLLMVFVFMMTELPQGIFAILNGNNNIIAKSVFISSNFNEVVVWWHLIAEVIFNWQLKIYYVIHNQSNIYCPK